MTTHHEIQCPSCAARFTLTPVEPALSRPRQDIPIVDAFLRTIPTDAAPMTSAELFEAFEAWADDQTGDHGMTPRKLTTALLRRGWTFTRSKGIRKYRRPTPEGIVERHDRGTAAESLPPVDRSGRPTPVSEHAGRPRLHPSIVDPDLMVGAYLGQLRTAFPHGVRYATIVAGFQVFAGERANMVFDRHLEANLQSNGWTERGSGPERKWFPPARTPGQDSR